MSNDFSLNIPSIVGVIEVVPINMSHGLLVPPVTTAQVPWVCCAFVWATSLAAPTPCYWRPWVPWRHVGFRSRLQIFFLEYEAATYISI